MSLFTLTVNPGECLLERRPGLPTRALEAGKHRRRSDATYVQVDLRERLTQLAPQDVPTSDGLSVKLTVAVRWTVVDAVRFTERAADPFALVYLAVQVALRDALADVPVDSALGAARHSSSSSRPGPRRRRCGRWRTPPSCSTRTRRSPVSGWSRRCRTARR